MQAKKALILGIGGAGLNIVSKLYKQGRIGADFAAIDTSKSHIERLERGLKSLHISYSKGVKLDPGALFSSEIVKDTETIAGYVDELKDLKIWATTPAYGEEAVIENQEAVGDILKGHNLLIIIASLGSGTGAGASLGVARMAMAYGMQVFAIVIMPFSVERAKTEVANDILPRLKPWCDVMLVIDNNELLKNYPDLTVEAAFNKETEMIGSAAKKLVEAHNALKVLLLDKSIENKKNEDIEK